MPSRPKRHCRRGACPNLVDGSTSYCPQHLAASRKVYDRDHRPKQRQRLYDTQAWRGENGKRNQIIEREPTCRVCKQNVAYAVDHIIPLEDAPELAMDDDNLQPICRSCHSEKTAKENKDKGRW